MSAGSLIGLAVIGIGGYILYQMVEPAPRPRSMAPTAPRTRSRGTPGTYKVIFEDYDSGDPIGTGSVHADSNSDAMDKADALGGSRNLYVKSIEMALAPRTVTVGARRRSRANHRRRSRARRNAVAS